MTTELAVRDKTMITSREKRTPDELVAEGRSQAEALMKVVRAAGLSKDLGGSKPHLEVEAWQTIMRFNGFLPTVVWAKAIVEGGAKVGYEARAELVDVNTGQHLIGAEAQCRFDEELERADGTTFQRWTDDYACESMAQTRAVSKLGRVGFAWVAVLGGYSGTPAEEMDGVKRRAKAVTFPFGEYKGQEPSALDLAALHKALPFWERQAADPNNKFAEANKRLVSAIKDAIAEKTAAVTTVEAPSQVNATPDPSVMTDLEKAWAEAHELMQAKEWTEAKVTVWARKAKGVGPKELDLLGVQALCAHLRSLG